MSRIPASLHLDVILMRSLGSNPKCGLRSPSASSRACATAALSRTSTFPTVPAPLIVLGTTRKGYLVRYVGVPGRQTRHEGLCFVS